MKTSWFTFGQSHVHRVNGNTFDCDTVVKITSPDPPRTMTYHFGLKWAFEYDNEPDMRHYPKGVIEL